MQSVKIAFVFFLILLEGIVGIATAHSQSSFSDTVVNSLSKKLIIDSIYSLATDNGNDTLKNEALSQYVKFYYRTKNWKKFHQYRTEQLKLSLKIKDSASYAKALEYSGAYFMHQNIPDSAYYYYHKSFRIYDLLCDSLSAGKALLNNAIIQKNVADYIGSEATSFTALQYLLPTQNERRISSVYNNLGIVYNQLEDFENAIKYHQLALNLRKNISDSQLYTLHSLNNIGKAYADKKDYNTAIDYYEQILDSTSLLQKNKVFYAIVLDNHSYARFKKGDHINIERLLKEALSIREELDEIDGIIINCIHLAEYYKEKGDSLLALEYTKRAEKLSDSIKNYRDFLASLELMVGLYDTDEAKIVFKKYIHISDSLEQQARTYKDQFARIRFETEEKENIIRDQNENILIQKDKIHRRHFIIISLIAVFLLIILAFRARAIHKKRKQKQLEQELMKGFEPYLKEKYKLTNHNLEFWNIWVSAPDQQSIADRLFITLNSVKSRRKSLREKIEKVVSLEGKFNRAQAINIYNQERDFYQKNQKDSSLKS